MKKLTIGILAHVDSGKTTLSEAIMFLSGKIRELGRVDKGNAYLDTHSLEKSRGITIFSKQAEFKYLDTSVTLLDTPGHVDFSSEAERTLQVLDCAVLVISGTDGVQSHTQTIWSLLSKYKIPTFIFVNKMDLAGSDKSQVIANLKEKLHQAVVDFTELDNDHEEISLCSESLMEEYLEGGELSSRSLSRSIEKREIFPCYFGSALKLEGVKELLDGINLYTEQNKYGKKFGARIFKITWDNQGNRITHMKITGGSLKVKAVIFGKDKEKNDWSEKVNQIRIYSGAKFSAVNEVFAGEVCGVLGLSKSYAGEGLGFEESVNQAVLQPVLTYKVILPIDVDILYALSKLRILEEEDPLLQVVWNERLKEIHICLMGAIQLEIIRSIVNERFSFPIDFDKGNIVYKETIKNKVYGSGHFEPLRHYSEVHLLLEPLERGRGLIFTSTCSVDELDRNWQNLVLTHLEEKPHLGVLTGSPITDMKITLVAGKAHEKHTEGGDFRQSTYRAVRQGLMQAESQLLEPYYAFTLTVPSDCVGRGITDIQNMGGSYEAPETEGEITTIKGLVPVSSSREYQTEVIRYTKGLGQISFSFFGYDNCHNSDEVMSQIAYQPENDIENTPDSVFCSHGSGFNVKWNEVKDYMHIKLEDLGKKKESINTHQRFEFNFNKNDPIENDKELLKIFEGTYGKIKADPRIGFTTVKKANKSKTLDGRYKRSEKLILGEEYVLVDGYNIIHDWDNLKGLAKENLPAARAKLMDILSNYAGYTNCKLILVFDAYKVKGNVGTVEEYHNISVVYTKEAETADMYIEKVTNAIGRKYRVRVATSDAMEQLIILGHGALRISAQSFYEEIVRINREISDIIS